MKIIDILRTCVLALWISCSKFFLFKVTAKCPKSTVKRRLQFIKI